MNTVAAQTDLQAQSKTVQRGALIVSSLTSFLGPFMGSSVNVALPSMGREFAMSAVLLGWVNMSFLLAAAAFSIPFGRLGDIVGRKRIYMAGVVVFTAASVLIAMAPSGTLLILGRGVQGFGSSLIFATGMAILISVYPPRDRGKVLGINVAAVYFGLSSGPFIGGIVTQYLGWRFLFWFNLPIGIVLWVLMRLMLKGEWAEDQGARFDWGGTLLLAPSLSVVVYSFSTLPDAHGFGLLAIGMAGMVCFVIYEKHLEAPLIDVRLFSHNRVFAFSSLAALINYAATFAVGFLLSLYLQKVRGLSPRDTGLIMISQPGVQAVLSPLAGRLSDRIEPRTVASAGMGLCFLGLLMLNFVSAKTSFCYIIACLVCLGLGFAFFSSPNTKAIMGSVDRKIYGVTSAVVGTMRQVGMTFSMGVVMMILSLYLGQAEVGPENALAFVDSMKMAFLAFALMCFFGVFASLARGKTRE